MMLCLMSVAWSCPSVGSVVAAAAAAHILLVVSYVVDLVLSVFTVVVSAWPVCLLLVLSFFLFFGFSFVVLLFCVVLIDYPVRRDYVTDVSSFLSCLAVVLCILEPLCLFALSCLAVMFLWSLNSCFIYWCSCFSDFFF